MERRPQAARAFGLAVMGWLIVLHFASGASAQASPCIDWDWAAPSDPALVTHVDHPLDLHLENRLSVTLQLTYAAVAPDVIVAYVADPPASLPPGVRATVRLIVSSGTEGPASIGLDIHAYPASEPTTETPPAEGSPEGQGIGVGVSSGTAGVQDCRIRPRLDVFFAKPRVDERATLPDEPTPAPPPAIELAPAVSTQQDIMVVVRPGERSAIGLLILNPNPVPASVSFEIGAAEGWNIDIQGAEMLAAESTTPMTLHVSSARSARNALVEVVVRTRGSDQVSMIAIAGVVERLPPATGTPAPDAEPLVQQPVPQLISIPAQGTAYVPVAAHGTDVRLELAGPHRFDIEYLDRSNRGILAISAPKELRPGHIIPTLLVIDDVAYPVDIEIMGALDDRPQVAEHKIEVTRALALALVLLGLAMLALVRRRSHRHLFPLWWLYSRLSSAQILDHPRRVALLHEIGLRPGRTIRELRDALGVTNGVIEHHIGCLCGARVVRVVKDGRNSRVYLATADPAHHITSDLRVAIAHAVRRSPGATLAEIARDLGISRQLAQYHASRMVASGQLAKRQDGRSVRLTSTEAAR